MRSSPRSRRNRRSANRLAQRRFALLRFLLDRTDAILAKVEKEPKKRESTLSKPFPPPAPAPPATIAISEWPNRHDLQPSPLAFVWPASRGNLTAEEILLLELFAE